MVTDEQICLPHTSLSEKLKLTKGKIKKAPILSLHQYKLWYSSELTIQLSVVKFPD
jgi:hypothetical protein